ncbi:MAG: AmmeMemoRadiSam system protein B [Candidatus Omnitrophica bacterium]|nr:AmmeMemoRadiSam system protein B [Candidatus Omnitrophota bacterium]
MGKLTGTSLRMKRLPAGRQAAISCLKIASSLALLAMTNTIFTLAFAEETKQPVVAGSFYPADLKKLKTVVSDFIDSANPDPINGEIIALILPHAGYEYSGHIAGYGIKLIQGGKFDTVIIIGPSHRVSLKGLAVLDKDLYQTPLGKIAIDKEITANLLSYNKNISYNKQVFASEHSAEVEIPFIQSALPDSKIAVILTGEFSYDNCLLLRDALTDIARSAKKKVLMVVSTDMSHYNPERAAKNIDGITIKEMEKLQPDILFTEFLSLSAAEVPCGATGMIGVMMAAKNLGANELKVVKYATSADTTFDPFDFAQGQSRARRGIDKNAVVGYCAAAIYKSRAVRPQIDKEKQMEGLLNAKQKKRLLEIARQTLEGYIKNGKISEFKEDDPALNNNLGAFVTLHKHGDLRGCIGNMVGQGPLYLTIRDMAIESSTQDPRFSPVSANELKDIDIEISVLSPMEQITDPSKIIMGKHGVLVRSGFRSGVFLPQVATETGWDRETFMNNLCAHKAGLAENAWKSGKCDIFIFTAEIFGEK